MSKHPRRRLLSALLAVLMIVLSGCEPYAESTRTLPEPLGQVPVISPEPATPSPQPTVVTAVPTRSKSEPKLAVTTSVPELLVNILHENGAHSIEEDPRKADFILAPAAEGEVNSQGALWFYALAAPFPTVADSLSLAELRGIWGGTASEGKPQSLYLTAETLAAFSTIWGTPEGGNIRIANKEQLLELAWAEEDSLALIPFEEISPRWKVLQVDGLSPLDPGLDTAQYPLKIHFVWTPGSSLDAESVLPPPELPAVNREPDKFTTLVMTGTTALARYIAAKMVENGIEYPLEGIAPWLQEADFTHISNEVSFYEDCPPALPARRESRFCSDPDYIRLLEAAGADVIELTGNHNLDWGVEPYLYSLELYRERGFLTYGGGENLAIAHQPLIVEHAGTKLAFLGCNIAGPENAWAAEDSPGAAPCDLDWMAGEIARLRGEGIIPVVTFQHYEVDDYQPMNLTRQHFQRMAEAGAVIVSGSQAHFPHGFTFYGDSFLHYGLGNLFFDQMYPGNRREFIDRHVFYDGRYLGVELLTAMLEDYARPRPMTPEERAQMLSDYFKASGW